ncbi:hypothetical protein ACH4F6_20670 [Streptomyces sp. NPDC017936]|uniref:Rv1733c family protein n=1 Tax=Streptomyces sp. NPDC017936 TaxID=3365016 RepID=UPI00378E2844
MRIRVRGWRWRRNPLRRRSDVVEAWTAVVVAVLLLVVAPLVGAVAGQWAHDDARAMVAEQQADRRHVRAEVVGRPPEALPTAQGGQEEWYRVAVRWTEPGQGSRTAVARVPAGTHRGDRVDVWFDTRGRSVGPPANGTAVWQHTLTMGVAAAGGTAAAVLLGHAVVRRVALRHRLDEWDREWARTGPEWSRRRA